MSLYGQESRPAVRPRAKLYHHLQTLQQRPTMSDIDAKNEDKDVLS